MKNETVRILTELGFNPKTVTLKLGGAGKIKNKKIVFIFLPPELNIFYNDGIAQQRDIYRYIITK